jgi:DNA-binding CsgD family transcriptional regulator
VLLHESGVHAPLLPEHARSIFGLSRAESLVAALLHQGLDLAGIAGALEISRNTARVHLNAILAKTDTHRQAMLMQQLDAVAELHGASGASQ